MGRRKRKTNNLKAKVKRLTGGGCIMSNKNVKRWCKAMTAK